MFSKILGVTLLVRKSEFMCRLLITNDYGEKASNFLNKICGVFYPDL